MGNWMNNVEKESRLYQPLGWLVMIESELEDVKYKVARDTIDIPTVIKQI